MPIDPRLIHQLTQELSAQEKVELVQQLTATPAPPHPPKAALSLSDIHTGRTKDELDAVSRRLAAIVRGQE